MPSRQPGNGSVKFLVHQQDMGGWVRVFTAKQATVPTNFPMFLSLSLTEWFRQRPHLSLQSVVPVVQDGNTVELHAWYVQTVFPNLAAETPQKQG
jgi:hypothetical protein